jgi:hypothetical protein
MAITTLADFATLTTLLNQTQLQRDNPALYNILNLLIKANVQSQNTIVNNSIPDAIAAIPAPVPGVLKLFEIPSATVSANFFSRNSSPLQLLPAVSGVSHIPLYCALYSLMQNTGAGGSNYTNGATNWVLTSDNPPSTTLPWMSIASLSLTAPGSGTLRGYRSALGNFSTNNIGNTAFLHVGRPLYLMSVSDVSGGGGGTMGLTLLYVDTSNDLY